MSRLQQYILGEDKKFAEISSMVQRDCKPFLKELNGCKDLLYRGSRRRVNDISKVKSRLKNRTPSDTSEEIHNHMNKLFENEFGWPARNGIFTTGDFKVTRFYGNGYIFFPVGKYKYVWSPDVQDFFTQLEEDDEYLIYYPENYINDKDLERDWEYDDRGYWEYNGKLVNSDNPNDIIYELDIDYEDYDEDLLEWIPEMSFEEYRNEVYGIFEKERDEYFQNLANLYMDNKLDKAIKSKHEVIFNCKEYYLIPEKFSLLIKEEIL